MKRLVLVLILLVAIAIVVLEVLRPTPSLPALWGAAFAGIAAGAELVAEQGLRRKEARARAQARARCVPQRPAEDWGWPEVKW